MANMSVDGLISGLDTSTLISQLMSVERQSQTTLKGKQTTQQNVLSIYQALNTKMKALGDAADALRTTTSAWQSRKATSSAPDAVVVTAAAGSTSSSLTFDVVKTAASHTVLSGGFVGATTAVVASGPVTVNGTTIANIGDGSLSAVISAINASDAGVVAVAVQTAPNQYRLQITGKTSGEAGVFTDTAGFSAELTGTGFTTVTQGQDAELRVGTTTPYKVTSGTNTFSELLPGLTLTVKQPATGVVVDLASDAEAIAGKVKAFVDAANDALSYIKSNSTYDATTKKAGVLLADYTGGRIRDDLTDAVAGYVSGGESAATVGITLNRDGTLAFDKDKFAAAYAADPAKVAAHFQQGDAVDTLDDGLAERVYLKVKAATDFTSGYLTGAIGNKNDVIKDLGTQISAWDERLAIREKALRLQFSNLETMLSKLQNQGTWLAGQVNSLTAS